METRIAVIAIIVEDREGDWRTIGAAAVAFHAVGQKYLLAASHRGIPVSDNHRVKKTGAERYRLGATGTHVALQEQGTDVDLPAGTAGKQCGNHNDNKRYVPAHPHQYSLL